MMPSLALVQALLACGCGGSDGGSGKPPGNSVPPTAVAPTPPPAPAPVPAPTPTPTPSPAPVCETRDVYTLCITELDTRVSDATLDAMKEQFFIVYPLLTDRFNHAAPLTVNFVIGPTVYVAYAGGNTVTYNPMWFWQHPNDLGVVAHELMHVVQGYPHGPSWLTEGIADYARYYYGVNDGNEGWNLHPPYEGEGYDFGYQVTARFLIWVEQRYDVELVEALDATMREGRGWTPVWFEVTGKTASEVWNEYLLDPAIE